MKETIYTIPINDAYDIKCGCPICTIEKKLETESLEYVMGAAMMEPDVRIETNKLGFCKTHFDFMLKQKNRLSLALMLQTHLMELDNEIFKKKSFFEGKTAKHKKVSQINQDCFVCSKIEWGMSRLMVTFFELYGKESEFRKLFAEQEMLCLHHYELLVGRLEEIDKKYQNQFVNDCNALVKKQLDILVEDVSHYCNMYDYRNGGKDADWKNSKDSIERSIRFLTTR